MTLIARRRALHILVLALSVVAAFVVADAVPAVREEKRLRYGERRARSPISTPGFRSRALNSEQTYGGVNRAVRQLPSDRRGPIGTSRNEGSDRTDRADDHQPLAGGGDRLRRRRWSQDDSERNARVAREPLRSNSIGGTAVAPSARRTSIRGVESRAYPDKATRADGTTGRRNRSPGARRPLPDGVSRDRGQDGASRDGGSRDRVQDGGSRDRVQDGGSRELPRSRQQSEHFARKLIEEDTHVDSETANAGISDTKTTTAPSTDGFDKSSSPSTPADTLENIWPLLYETYLMPPSEQLASQDQLSDKASHQDREGQQYRTKAEKTPYEVDMHVMNRLWAAVHDGNMESILKVKGHQRQSSVNVNWIDSIKNFISGQIFVEIGSGVTSLATAIAFPSISVITIVTDESIIPVIQRVVAAKNIKNLFLCYLHPSEIFARMKLLHRHTKVMFGTMFVSNVTALIGGYLPHEFEEVMSVLLGLTHRFVVPGPNDMDEQTRAFFGGWTSVKEMVERSLVRARITASVRVIVRDVPSSLILPSRVEDKDLPKEVLDGPRYTPASTHLAAYVVISSSSQRFLDPAICRKMVIRSKQCKLLSIAINGSTFVFLQTVGKKKSSSTSILLNPAVSSLSMHEIMLLGPVPQTLAYFAEQINSHLWRRGQNTHTLHVAADQVLFNSSAAVVVQDLSKFDRVSSQRSGVATRHIPRPNYSILVTSPGPEAEGQAGVRYPAVADPQSFELSRSREFDEDTKLESRLDTEAPRRSAPQRPLSQPEVSQHLRKKISDFVNRRRGTLPNPMPGPSDTGTDRQPGDLNPGDSNEERDSPEDAVDKDKDKDGELDTRQEGDFPGHGPPALDSEETTAAVAAANNNDNGDSEEKPNGERMHTTGPVTTGSEEGTVPMPEKQPGNAADEDVARDHLDVNGQPETEFRNDDIRVGGVNLDSDADSEAGNEVVDGEQVERPGHEVADRNGDEDDGGANAPADSDEDGEDNDGGEKQKGRHLLSVDSGYSSKQSMRRLLWTKVAASKISPSSLIAKTREAHRTSSSAATKADHSTTSAMGSKTTKSGQDTVPPRHEEDKDGDAASEVHPPKEPSLSKGIKKKANLTLEEFARKAAFEMQEEAAKKPELLTEEMQFNAQWSVIRHELERSAHRQFSVFVYGGLTQVLLACKIAHVWPDSTVLLVVKPSFVVAFERYRKLRSTLKLPNIIGSMEELTPSMSMAMAVESDVAEFQILGVSIFADVVTEPKSFVPHLSRLLSFGRTTFLELPSPKQLKLSSTLLRVSEDQKSDLNQPVLQSLVYRSLMLAGASNASMKLLPVSALEHDMWLSGYPLLKIRISSLQRQVMVDCSTSQRGVVRMSPSGVSQLNGHRLARAGFAFSLSLLLAVGINSTEKQQLFIKYLRLPLSRDMCPKFVCWRSGHLLYDHMGDQIDSVHKYQFEDKKALVQLLRENVDKARHWSFLEYGSGLANATIDLAIANPNSTFISLESSTSTAYKQQKRLDELKISNMVVGRIHSDSTLLRKLLESPDMMRYQMIGMDYFLDMIKTFTRMNFNTMLGSVFSTGVSSFVQVPSAKMISLAFQTFFPEVPSGVRHNPAGPYLLKNHPSVAFENAELRMIGESAKSPAESTVTSHILHPFSRNDQEHGWKLIRVDLANLTTMVNHHFDYAIDGHDRKYTQHCESNATHFRVFLERQVDGFLIPYDRLEGISLIALLRLGLLANVKSRLYEQFIKMPLYEDMAPWNIVFNGGRLEYIDYDTKDITFDKMVPAAYQIMSVLMNFQRTVKDFGHCNEGEARTAYNFPYMGSCVGSSFHGKCRNSKYPVPCGDQTCRSSYIECLQGLLQMEKKKEKKTTVFDIALSNQQQHHHQRGGIKGQEALNVSPVLPDSTSSPFDAGHWSFNENGFVDHSKQANTGIR